VSQTVAATTRGAIEYRREGEGPVVMVLNGGHCSRDTRLSHERLVSEGFSVLTPSRPGYDSTPDSVGRSVQDAADAMAVLLDALEVPVADVIGISAAGPTALALAQRHPNRVRKLVLESAMATDWDEAAKRRSRIGFGRAAPITWGALHAAMRIAPIAMLKVMMRDLTTLDADEVVSRMSQSDLAFAMRLLQTCRASTGFLNDIDHHVEGLGSITAPTLVMYPRGSSV
jgi:pimeloyl-ACP methyl ester carboxylesterase